VNICSERLNKWKTEKPAKSSGSFDWDSGLGDAITIYYIIDGDAQKSNGIRSLSASSRLMTRESIEEAKYVREPVTYRVGRGPIMSRQWKREHLLGAEA